MNNRVVIVGSGLGGLVCGYILARHGFHVTILEKHHQIGGCLQTFRRAGVRFDTGMHYVGSLDQGQVLDRLWRYLDLRDKIELSRLDPEGFDVISIGGEKFRMASGPENFVESLSAQFPEDRADIQSYIDGLEEVVTSSVLYNLRSQDITHFTDDKYLKITTDDFIKQRVKNPKLRNVLLGTLPLYAGCKEKTPIYIHAMINMFYIRSAFRIVGGSDHVAKTLADSIRKMGGVIRTKAQVEELICQDNVITAAKLTTGELVTADGFISNVHPKMTLGMVKGKILRKSYRKRIGDMTETTSSFIVYLKFKPESVAYQNYNYYHYDYDDVWQSMNYTLDTFQDSYIYMHQCEQQNQKWATGGTIISYMKYEDVARWDNNRNAEYEDFKREMADRLIAKLDEAFPGISSRIESYSCSTPLTYKDYTATYSGSIYGIMADVNHPMGGMVTHKTRISNLRLVGQSTNSHGILGVTIGALVTCSEYIDLKKLINEIQ